MGQAVKTDQFYTLLQLARMRESSKSAKAAKIVLCQGKSQIKAAQMLSMSQSTISKAISRIKNAKRLANKLR